MHGRVGDSLEALLGDRAGEQAPLLAQHFVGSATVTEAHAAKAVRYSKLAAERAERESAFDEAVRHYEACTKVMRESGNDFGEDEAALLAALAASCESAAQSELGVSALERALALYRVRADGIGFGRALHEVLSRGGLCLVRIAGDALADGLRLRDEAAERVGDTDPILRVQLLAGFGILWDITPEQEADARRLAAELDMPDVGRTSAQHRRDARLRGDATRGGW